MLQVLTSSFVRHASTCFLLPAVPMDGGCRRTCTRLLGAAAGVRPRRCWDLAVTGHPGHMPGGPSGRTATQARARL